MFYLLIAMCFVVPAVWFLTVGYTVGTVELGSSIPSEYLAPVLLVIVLFSISALTFWNYSGSPRRIAKESQLKSLQEGKFPEQYGDVRQLYSDYPHTFNEPTLLYNLDPEVSAFTFGTRKSQDIQMSAGLLLTNEPGTFRTIVQHEMGHLENKDVGKTTLAVSAMSAMKVFLPATLAAWVIYDVYLKAGILYYGTIAGTDPSYLLSQMQLGVSFAWIAVLALSFVAFGAIAFVLRNQIIRLREFYADARVVEWTKLTTGLENTLHEHRTLSSRFESLRRFHPSSEERIKVLRNNSSLFVPSLWVALIAGFLYDFFATEIPSIWQSLYMPQSLAGATPSLGLVKNCSIFLSFGVLMFVISSEFHKSLMREALADKTQFISAAALLRMAEYVVVFILGLDLAALMLEFEGIVGYLDQLGWWASSVWSNFTAVGLSLGVRLFVVLVFLWFFGSVLVRRSFSRRDATQNFFLASVLASALFALTTTSIVRPLFNNDVAWVLSIAGFVVTAYLIVKVSDWSRRCPSCGSRVLISSKRLLACPHCGNGLYSWAFSSA